MNEVCTSTASLTETTESKYCFCKKESKEVEVMVQCCREDKCPHGEWFHINCVGMEEDEVPDGKGDWFCTEHCEAVFQNRLQICKCKSKYNDEDELLICVNAKCNGGQYLQKMQEPMTSDYRVQCLYSF